MSWFTIDAPHYRHAFREIAKQRDRGAAIIAVAILEEHLLEAIKERFTRNPDLENKLLKGNGPLSSLSAKIDLGLLLGIYDKNVHSSLHEIRLIRNDFAHNSSPASFASQRDRCAKLAFQKGLRRKWNAKFAEIIGQPMPSTMLMQHSTKPRIQFLSAVRTITAMLAFNIMMSKAAKEWLKEPGRAPEPAPPPSLDKS